MRIETHIPLRRHTTFKVGGPARFFCCVAELDDLRDAYKWSDGQGLSVFILGEGSNVLAADEGTDGLVLKIKLKGASFQDVGSSRVRIIAAAGEHWDDIVAESVERGLYGIENLSGIPGTVGATPIQNIGAYGVEVKDVIEWVEVFDHTTNKLQTLLGSECHFGYRTSIFKKENSRNFVITKVCYLLKKEGEAVVRYEDVAEYFSDCTEAQTPRAMREAVLAIRARKFPDMRTTGTAGSFFKNPVIPESDAMKLTERFPLLPQYLAEKEGYRKISLAWLLDNVCGLKGFRINNIGIFKNQPLVLVNYGDGSAADIRALAEKIQKDVYEKTGIKIEPEVTYI